MESLVDLKPDDCVLFLAEGNFTFSTSLVELWIKTCEFQIPTIIATCFESRPVSKIAEENVQKLLSYGVKVLFSVDATKCDFVDQLDNSFVGFTKVTFMFPHVGGKSKIHLNRQLLKNFARSISQKLKSPESQVIIALCGGQGGTCFDPVQRVIGDTWQIVPMTSFGELQLVDVDFFDIGIFPDYKSFGYRGFDRGFHSEKGIVHVFEPSPLRSDNLEMYDIKSTSVFDLKQKYVEEKIRQFFCRSTLIWIAFRKVAKIYLNGLSVESTIVKDEKFIENMCADHSLILNDSFENVEVSKESILEDSRKTIKPVFLVDFTLDFTKCPVTVCLLAGPFHEKIESSTCEKISKTFVTKDEKISRSFFNKSGNFWVLVNISELALKEECLENWQLLWSLKKCLEPQFYSHDLAYTFDPNSERREISEQEMCAVLWTLGFDTVTDFNLFDVFIDSEGLTSNTIRLNYQSHQFPLSKDKAWTIHYDKIGSALAQLFNVTLR